MLRSVSIAFAPFLFACSTVSSCAGPGATAPAAATCAADEVDDPLHGCLPARCGLEPWPAVPDDAVFVDADAAADGDGSRERPLRTVQDALEAVRGREERVIAVAAGTYRDQVWLNAAHDGVRLVGRCPEVVTFDGADVATNEATMLVTSSDPEVAFEVRGVAITNGPDTGIEMVGGQLLLADARLVANASVQLWQTGGVVTLDTVRIEDGAPDTTGAGAGVFVGGGALQGTEVTIARSRGPGIFVVEDGAATLADCVIEEAQRSDTGDGDGWVPCDGFGACALSGASLSLSGCSVRENAVTGVMSIYEGSLVELDDSEVVGTLPLDDAPTGFGVVGVSDGVLVMRGGTLTGNYGAGAVAESGTVELHDVAVYDNMTDATGVARGGWVTRGGMLVVAGGTFDGHAGVALEVTGPGSTLSARDTTVRGTEVADHGEAYAVLVYDGATATLDRVVLEDNAYAAVGVTGGGSLDMTGSRVSDTRPVDGAFGRGIAAESDDPSRPVTVTLEGARIERNREAGIAANGPGVEVTVRASTVVETTPAQRYAWATGVYAQNQATVRVYESWLGGNAGAGAYAAIEGVLDIEDTQLAGNAFAGVASLGGSVTLRGGVVEDNGFVGVYAGSPFRSTQLDLDGTTVGAHDHAAVWIGDAGTYTLRACALAGGEGLDLVGDTELHGNALFATGLADPTDLAVEGCSVSGAADAGVLLHGATGTFTDVAWADNGVDLVQQACGALEHVPEDAAPAVEVCPATDRLVRPLDFSITVD